MEQRPEERPVTSKPKDPDQAFIIGQPGVRAGWPERESALEMSALIPLMLDSTLRCEIASSKRGTW